MDKTKNGWLRTLGNRDLSFAGNATLLAGGSAIASLISLASEPIISRLFPPEVFGIVYAFYSMATIIGLLVCFRYEQAIILPDNSSDAAGLLKLSALLLFGWLILLFMLVWITDLVIWLEWESIRSVVWMLPVLAGMLGFWHIFSAWHIRKKNFLHISISSVLVQIPQVLVIIIGGYLGYNSAVDLVNFRTIGIFLPALFLFTFFILHDSSVFRIRHSAIELFRLAKRFKKFPLFEFWSVLLGVIAFNGPVLLFPVLFDAGSAGHFSKAFFVLYVVPMMIGSSINQVLFQQIAEYKNKGQSIEAIIRMTIKSVLLIGAVPFVLVSTAGPEIFSILLGSRWETAGQFSQGLSILLFFMLIGSSIRSVFLVYEKQEKALILNSLSVMVRLGTLIICSWFLESIMLTVLIFSIGSGIIELAKVIYILKLVKLHILHLFSDVKYYLLLILLIAGMVVLINNLTGWSNLLIFSVCVLLAGFYYLILLMTQPTIKNLILTLINKRRNES